MVFSPTTQPGLQRAHPAPSRAVPFPRILITGLDLRKMISVSLWGLETLSETEGPLENLAQPLHPTDKATESQADSVIHSGSRRGRAPTQNFLDPNPLLSELDCPSCLCTYSCLVCELQLVFINNSPHRKC